MSHQAQVKSLIWWDIWGSFPAPFLCKSNVCSAIQLYGEFALQRHPMWSTTAMRCLTDAMSVSTYVWIQAQGFSWEQQEISGNLLKWDSTIKTGGSTFLNLSKNKWFGWSFTLKRSSDCAPTPHQKNENKSQHSNKHCSCWLLLLGHLPVRASNGVLTQADSGIGCRMLAPPSWLREAGSEALRLHGLFPTGMCK